MNKTFLHEEHLRLKAKIIEFAGYDLPLEFSGIKAEHKAVRSKAGLFDVSHMGKITISGIDAYAFVEKLITNHIPRPPINKAVYALMCNENGFIIDDLLVYPLSDFDVLLVVNASNLEKDYQWIIDHKESHQVTISNVTDFMVQIAIQGPEAINVLVDIFNRSIDQLKFMNFKTFVYRNQSLLISRSGYTGEDGFEIYGPPQLVKSLYKQILQYEQVVPCGLGARDTLRFEAALSLYGHEISDSITPLEANLNFAVKFDKDFIGKDALLKQKEIGVKRTLVGLLMIERGIARTGYIIKKDGQNIGYITTGYALANHSQPIALALIDCEYSQIGSRVHVLIRDHEVLAEIRDTNFMEKQYKR
jgi:aminomethyltransferase